MSNFTESVDEDTALAWLESLGYTVKHLPEIAPGELGGAKNRMNRTNRTNSKLKKDVTRCRKKETSRVPG